MNMKPLEAYRIISQCMQELHEIRKEIFSAGRAYSHEELTAQVIAFEALRRMEEDGDKKR